MHLILLELAQQVVDLLRLRHEIRRTDERLPAEISRLRQMRQQILDIKDATHVINGVLIDGDTGIVILNDALDDIGELASEIEIDNILTTRHHLLGSLVSEAHDALQHIFLFLQLVLVGQFERLFQIIDAEHVALLLHHLRSPDAGTDQDRGYGIK